MGFVGVLVSAMAVGWAGLVTWVLMGSQIRRR
jgi:hypothetical protein